MESRVAVKSKEKSHSRGESVKNEGIVKEVDRVKGKESKVKRGTGTEKQILREKIKNMLVGAGWTIDYRPRRNRAYMDAVYVSPSGTGYWSIIKAYDAYQKEEEENSKNGGGKFTPLADEVLAKLTRQTQKKTEREMESKRKSEDGEKEEKLNSYGRKSRKLGRCSLLVREAKNDDGFVPYSGKRTLLSWLIDSGVVHLRDHVEYMNRRKTRILQKGWIANDGIHCGCCNKIVTVLKFEVHAGSKLGHPFPNIFLDSGKSLMQCQIDAWNKLGELERKGFYTVDDDGDDPNDDTCGLCGDGGDLICCDGCPSTFHQTCLDLPMLPQGDWFCPNCSCKYCEIACTDSTQASLLTCYLCQKKHHESCRPEIDVKPIESNYLNLSFCGHACHELYSQLQKLVGVKHELDSGFSWSLIHRSEILMDAPSVQLSQHVECNSKLAVAMSIMDECFSPFTDRRSGINLIRNVVFNCGSNLSRLDYSGFFTAILERGDEVVCAASIRIHGTRLAEMPFIGTRHIYRRQGMCRRLLSAIEVALSSLQVEKLIIPAVPEHMDTWTDVFGFHPLEESDKQELRCMNMVVFPRTDMLQKPLIKVKTDSGSRDDAGPETPPTNSPCEPKLSGPVDAHSEPNADESTVQVDEHSELNADESVVQVDEHSEPNLDESTVQVDEHSEPNADESAVQVNEHSEPDADESTVQVNEHSEPNADESTVQVDEHSEPNADESTVQVANEITTEPQLPGVESVSVNGDSNANLEETDVQNAISLEAQAPKEPSNIDMATRVNESSGSDAEEGLSARP
ncbi:hypothetical protein L1987_40681 [Smallanthus sonchifolius]|uniref:Uncharacterized protein n=1 Tax=Smallanthus sonchifolius TaxID=185202 RepID=A0ACB9GTC6_9ASTR|nr:hypothetical protein L1987_40681 [Smallanthus sonchifolius]